MNLNLEASLVQAIDEKYQAALCRFPQKKREVDQYLEHVSDDESICIKFLYAFMTRGDMISHSPELMASYVKATLKMREEISYAKDMPAEIFLSYVLPCRVSNEDLDDSRGWMYQELADRVNGKSMVEAALEVNYWCYEKTTYIGSDARTLAPYGLCKSAKGRCGEESVLTVAAMRSVGIPARQCYVPGWAHCDNNHAWVEVWADGKWYYLGACEPDAVLNKGWFTLSASKAMVVLSSAYSHFLGDAIVLQKSENSAMINATETYGKSQNISVTVTKDGVPVSGVRVAFHIINYSRILPLHAVETNAEGKAEFLCGNGDLYISTTHNGVYVSDTINTRLRTELVLELNNGFRPDELAEDYEEVFDLNPPYEAVREAEPASLIKSHEIRMRQCEAIRAAYEATFVKDSGISEAWDKYFENAKGNHAEIRSFYEMEEFSEEDKRLMLDTLRTKDFIDCKAEVLADYLRSALPYKAQYPLEVYQQYILAPRILNEMLNACRSGIVQHLSERNVVLNSAEEVWSYMKENMTVYSEPGRRIGDIREDRCVYYNAVTPSTFGSVFVQICRALGIPARLNPNTRKPEAVIVENGELRYVLMEKSADESKNTTVKLTLKNTADKPVEYELSFMIERCEEDVYRPMYFDDIQVVDSQTVDILPGSYRLITTVRQINGAVSARVTYFTMKDDREIEIVLSEDRSLDKMLYAKMPDGIVHMINEQGAADENGVQASSLMMGRKILFIIPDPGKEPTEHLLQEILGLKTMCIENEYRIVLAVNDTEGMNNRTIQKVMESGIDVVPVLCTDETYIYELHEAFHVGDTALPFAAAISASGEGLFAFANYNIRTARILMNMLQESK